MLFLLIISSLCADPLPAINPTVFHGYIAPGTRSLPTCPEGFNFDTFIFNCTEAVNGYTTDPASCFIINETDFQSTSCLQDEHPDYTLVNNVWVITTSIVDEILCQSVHLSFQPRCNSLMALYRQAQTIVTPSTMVFQDTIQFLANLHAVSDYNQPINPIVTDFITTSFIMNYNYWPSNLPFYTYPSGRSLTISNIIDEQYITSQFQFAQITQFYLARYTWDGTFIGFSPLTTQLNRCGEKNDIEQMWRRFGTNYNSECFFDLLKGIDDEVNEFYELFLADGFDSEGNVILRPIPVVLNDFNCRRFYKFSNITGVVRIMNSANVQFNISNDDPTITQTPYFTFTTRDIPLADLTGESTEIRFTTDTNQHPLFNFQVNYTMDLSNFSQIFMILTIVAAVFALLVIVARVFFIFNSDGKFGMNMTSLLNTVAVIFDTIGMYFFIVAFSFSAFVLIFYKWQKAVFWCIPQESYREFELMKDFVYVSLAFLIAGTLIKVFVTQLSNNFVVIDWETPTAADVPVSAWRRVNVCNELNRLSTVRSYKISFTVISIAFILEGFNVSYLSTPIPSTRLITTGFSHWVLRFALDAFLWLIFMAAQYLFFHFVYWRFYGNPFFNVLDLCATSNLSLFITTSLSHGYYLHGRSVHSHSDVEMKKLSQALADEEEGLVSLRGLLPSTSDQVFEIFFSREFSSAFTQMHQSIVSQQNVLHFTVSAKEIPQQALASYKELNEFLRKFFDNSSEHKYVVQSPELLQIIFKAPPQILNESIMNKIKDNQYKKSFLGGAEWELMCMYMLIFCATDIGLESPCIGCFIVFIIDFLIEWIYGRLFRSRLARNSLLDSRFLLN